MRLPFDRPLFLLSLVTLIASAGTAMAQSVYWEPDSGTLGVGKTNELRLVFENCVPAGSVEPPAVAGLDFGRPNRATEMSSSNFSRFTRRTIFIYNARPTTEATIVIPAFEVETDKGRLTVAEARFDGVEASVGQSSISINDIIVAQIQVPKTTVWVGETIDVEYLLLGSRRYSWDRATDPQWAPSAFMAESFQEPEQVQGTLKNEPLIGYRYRTRIQATRAGTFKLDPVMQMVRVQTGERSVLSFFSQPNIERFSIESETPTITVLPLPEPAPDNFSGAIGELKFESKVVPQTAQVGEPITWTLTLSGTGNWPTNLYLPEREISTDFEIVQPDNQQSMDEGSLFSGTLTQDAVLIPTMEGKYQIGPVAYSFFDTTTGTYKNETVDPVTVTVEPPATSRLASGQQPPAPQPDTTPSSDESDTGTGVSSAIDEATLPPDLVSVGELPRDPIASPAFGAVPGILHAAWWLPFTLVPPILLWAVLAWKQMLTTDPIRERRQFRRKLLRDLRAIESASAIPTADDIHQWRASTRAMWGIVEAAPATDVLAAIISKSDDGKLVDDWSNLWREAEAALFGSHAELKSDWLKRAIGAAEKSPLKSAQPPLPVKIRFWNPRIVGGLLFLFVAFLPDSKAAGDAVKKYQQGDFAEARSIWSAELAANPKDWAAHNNIALTYAQENEWNRAVAHWAAAFLLNPGDDSVRSNLRLALNRTQGVDPLVRKLLAGKLADRAASRLSPGEWQIVFFASAGIVGIGLSLAVIALYAGRNGRILRRSGIALAICGVVGSTVAMTALDRYGLLAKPTAALTATASELRSIPTDLAEKQQTTPIAAGTVVVIKGSFLGWDQVVTGTGSTGWIRREVSTSFYGRPQRPPEIQLAGGNG